ncbi:MarR family winged helix-turn-helix transcriptional regulator [Scopulibacillus cellulosilyticus]|uniref:MarR family winged helix-turn-helix transcriptional regulator n=1 Tax=Scopulibacillus cellulosilyticus TaxID=2665665 RepID=A0ABW2PW81_9BACL
MDIEKKEMKQDKDPSLHLMVVLSHAYKSIMDYAKKDIKQYEINFTEFGVLELLYHKGPQPIQQIRHRILLASGSITYVVDQLEKKGYLKRRPCPDDRRVTYAELTDKGNQLLKEIFPKHKQALKSAMSGLEEEEKETLILLLKKLGISIKEQS